MLAVFLGFLSVVPCLLASDMDVEDSPVRVEYRFNRQTAGVIDTGSPWITGPGDKKYQFHVGSQSWLEAREHCLAQNSDLVTISTTAELEWVLSHYSPQISMMSERLLQVGLLVDTHDNMKQWHWVNHKDLNPDVISWMAGEPFDHADGREKCAVIRINEKQLDDIDCDQTGSAIKLYRFICERTREAHVKHEEVNNPIWKKLQDILDFFGIRGNSSDDKEKNGTAEDDEDYWEMVKNESTTIIPPKQDREETVPATSTVANVGEQVEGSGADEPVPEAPLSSSASRTNGAKTLEKALVADELLAKDGLSKLNDGAADNTEMPKASNVETTTEEPSRTTKNELLPVEEETKTKNPQMGYFDMLEKNMEKIEKIVNSFERIMDGATSETAPAPKVLEKTETVEEPVDKDAALTKADEEHAQAMAEDFEQAAEENKTHPNVNSGDLLIVSPEHRQNIENCENETEPTSVSKNKSERIEKFLQTLHRFLDKASSKDLKNLVDESKNSGRSLIEKLEQSVANIANSTVEVNGTNESKSATTLLEPEKTADEPKAIEKESTQTSSTPSDAQPDKISTEQPLATQASSESPSSEMTAPVAIPLPPANDEQVSPSSTEEAVSSTAVSPSTVSTVEPTDEQTPTIETVELSAFITQAPEKEANVAPEIEVNKVESQEKSSQETVTTSAPAATTEEDTETTEEELSSTAAPSVESTTEEGYEVNLKLYINNNTKDEHAINAKKAKKTNKTTLKAIEKQKIESAFPKPNFDLIPADGKIPENVQKAVQEEAKKVGQIYNDFNKRIDTTDLLKQIELTEKARAQMAKKADSLGNFGIHTPQNAIEKRAMQELEKMFEDLGRNFRTIVHG